MASVLSDPHQTILYLWSNLYIPTQDRKQVIAAVREIHEQARYQPYNPFPGGTGTPRSASSLVRLFVAPAENGWTRLIGQANMDLLSKLAEKLATPILYVWISDSDCGILTFGTDDFSAYLREGKTIEDFNHALKALRTATLERKTPENKTPLQGELADIAANYGVDSDQANKLIEKTIGQLFKKMGNNGSDQREAMALVSKQAQQGLRDNELTRRVNEVMACLTIAANWQEPSFKDLAAAYQIASQLDLDEDTRLLPGDEAILDKVEYPLDYKLAYYAR